MTSPRTTPVTVPGAPPAEGSAAAPAIEARDLYRFYHAGDDETLALRGVSLSVASGEMIAIVGPSGSGKSTLLACLAGLDDPDGGSVRVFGERISRRSETDRSRMRAASIGVLLQSGNLIEHLSILDNVRLAHSIARGKALRSRDGSRSPEELLADVGLGRRESAAPSHLSGGESARAGLAVALASSPQVLLADEPTGEVDAQSERAIIELLHDAAARGTAIIVVTHSDHLAASATRVIRLRDGALVDG